MHTHILPKHARALIIVSVVAACGGGGEGPAAPPAVATITVTPSTLTLVTGGDGTLSATARDASGAALQRDITWTSSSATVATVSAGAVHAVAPGTATITATSEGKSGTATITVNPAPPSSPAARWLAAATFDAARNQIVLFGGSSGLLTTTALPTFYNDTWTWNGTTWTRQSPPNAPSARDAIVMAYDADRQRVVLYGGRAAGTGVNTVLLTDTWEWDGTNWRQGATAGPPARSHMALGYDPQRRRIVMHGGSTADNQALFDTWEWDGTTWTQRASTAPSSFGLPSPMLYDSDKRALLTLVSDLVSGQTQLWQWNGTAWSNLGAGPAMDTPATWALIAPSNIVALAEGATTPVTWRWNGTSWTQLAATSPSRRFAPASAYDASRNQFVIFGGFLNNAQLNDTWVWNGTAWTRAQ